MFIQSSNIQVYKTHDNGGRPFSVHIDTISNIVRVFRNKYDDDNDDDDNINENEIYSTSYIQYWIGKSSCGNSEFDGNSILVLVDDNKYVYVGECIYSFKSYAKIVSYISDVGNNDVPYPYAKDEEGNVYLMIEDIVLTKINTDCVDPYDYFYSHSLITKDEGCRREPLTIHFINEWYIDGEKYTLCDTVDTSRYANKEMYAILQDGTRMDLSAQVLKLICEDHRSNKGFKSFLNKEMLVI